MNQTDARLRARILSRRTGRLAVADTFRFTLSGRLVRGGRSILRTWGVFDATTGEILEPGSPDRGDVPLNGGWR
jgi:hypothetical protein